MSAKVSFTTAGHLGHIRNGVDRVLLPQQQQQQNLPTSIPRTSISTSASSAFASASASALVLAPAPAPAPTSEQINANPDSHRQNHSSSKLPSFRFADRRPSISDGGRGISNVSDNGNEDTVKDEPDTDASLPNNNRNNSQSSLAALSHPSVAHHAPPSPVPPNPDPCVVPVSSPTQLPSADPGPVPGLTEASFAAESHQPTAVTGQTFALSGSADLDIPDTALAPSLTLPATAPKPAHPTTHHNHVKKQSVSASAPASRSSPPAQTPTTSLSTPNSPPLLPSRSRASSIQADSSAPAVDPPTQSRRPASFPDTSSAQQDVVEPPHSKPAVARSRSRRSLVTRRSNGAASSTHPPLSLNQERLQAVEAAQTVQSATQSSSQASSDRSSKDSLPGQRELILLKTLANSSPPDDRRASVSHRPPVSYRPPVNHNAQPSTSTPVRVPPIRAFRSSGSRKSLTLDMNSRARIFGDDPADSNHDRTLRALEGRSDQDFSFPAHPLSDRRDALDGDDTGDVFLKIAREEASRRVPRENPSDESQSVVSRATRSSHRRPYSSVVPGSKPPTSPPQVRRRLSDQQETSRQRQYDDDRVSEVSRVSTYRTLAREKAASVHPGEDLSRTRAGGSSLRGPPTTPRTMAFHDSDSSTYTRRRGGSISDNNSSAQTRSSTYRTNGQSKTYNSSPLVRSFEFPRQQGNETPQGGLEGTESTSSTNAPSTVWDELDDLKSRIHRLELTGKLPSTSGAAVSRLSDERPPTATTTVTTVSSSPKRPGRETQATLAVSTTSSHTESHPLLQSALSKSKPLLDAEVFRALEAVANDAIILSSMMGTAGQPGPISSGASTIGSGTTVTDRQLRRKADGICRGLTELCVALGEDRTQTRPQQIVQAPAQPANDAPVTPTVNKTFSGLTSQRRQSFGADQAAKTNIITSPRTMSKFEERRLTLLSGSALPGPRASASTPATPLEPISRRRSSLLVARTRRAGTEEPEDGRKSSMLRTRRAGTEEPDEGRKTSLFVRNRRGTVGEEDDDQMFRSPSRANTDLTHARNIAPELPPLPTSESSPLGSSALPRRRFASSSLNPSRLATPLNTNAPSSRRYLDSRANNDRDANGPERSVEDRPQRHLSLGQSMLSRTSSMIRRPLRDNNVTITQSSAAAGSYR